MPNIICFNNFWNGFLSNDPINYKFFIEFIEKIFNKPCVIGNYDNANILVECHFGDNYYIKKKIWDYTFFFTGENLKINYKNRLKTNLNEYDIVFTTNKDNNNNIVLPLFIVYMFCNRDYLKFIPNINLPIFETCTIMSHAPNLRGCFIEELEKKMQIYHGGSYKNNIGKNIGGGYNSNELLNFMKNHKFVISMENSIDDYYITEKIINALNSGTIPIYWGSPYIDRYINPKRFLWIKDEHDIDPIINTMLNMTKEKYITIVNEPIFIQDIEIVYNEIIDNIKNILTKK